jgi:hypothetical protein
MGVKPIRVALQFPARSNGKRSKLIVKRTQIQNGFLRAGNNDRCGLETPSEPETVLPECNQEEDHPKKARLRD